MIFDKNHKTVPGRVLFLAKKASDHGISFSQTRRCLFVSRKSDKEKNINGWFISDSLSRGIYHSIYYSIEDETFYMFSLKDMLFYEYIEESFVDLHASQFFMPEITIALVEKYPSERNFIWRV